MCERSTSRVCVLVVGFVCLASNLRGGSHRRNACATDDMPRSVTMHPALAARAVSIYEANLFGFYLQDFCSRHQLSVEYRGPLRRSTKHRLIGDYESFLSWTIADAASERDRGWIVIAVSPFETAEAVATCLVGGRQLYIEVTATSRGTDVDTPDTILKMSARAFVREFVKLGRKGWPKW